MPGTIIFRPIEANIVTKDKDILGKMDPYLSFHAGGLKRVKSQICKSGGNHPVWNDSVSVEVGTQSSLTVDLKDKDMLIDDKIGSIEVDLREVESQGQIRKWYPIFRKNEPAGELLMEASYNNGSLGGYGQQGLGQGTGLIAGQGLNQGLNQGYSQGLNQGSLAGGYPQTTVLSSTSYPVQSSNMMSNTIPLTTSIPTQQLGNQQWGNQQLGNQQLGQPLGFQQLGSQQLGGQQLGGQQYAQSADPLQFAREALSRGVDPLNTQQNFVHNMNQSAGLGGYGGQSGLMGQPGFNNPGAGQNLTETPVYSGTDPLLYEGDKNRYSHPAQQMSFGKGGVLHSDPNNQGGKLERKF